MKKSLVFFPFDYGIVQMVEYSATYGFHIYQYKQYIKLISLYYLQNSFVKISFHSSELATSIAVFPWNSSVNKFNKIQFGHYMYV